MANLEMTNSSNPLWGIPPVKVDMVNSPPHYQGEVECIDAIASALGREGFIAYCKGQVIKYSWRAGKKLDAAEDMRKAVFYAKRAAKALEEQR